MSEVSTNEMKPGAKIMLDGDPIHILENEYVKPGKGQAFNRIKFRNLKTGRAGERTLKSGEKLPEADIVEIEMTYLYNDGTHWHFMGVENYEQYALSAQAVEEASPWLKEQDICEVMLWNGEAISVTPPNFVTLKIIETDPGVRGDTSGGGSKPATLETGATVKVPLFVQEGELIKIDTRNSAYVSRIKE